MPRVRSLSSLPTVSPPIFKRRKTGDGTASGSCHVTRCQSPPPPVQINDDITPHPAEHKEEMPTPRNAKRQKEESPVAKKVVGKTTQPKEVKKPNRRKFSLIKVLKEDHAGNIVDFRIATKEEIAVLKKEVCKAIMSRRANCAAQQAPEGLPTGGAPRSSSRAPKAPRDASLHAGPAPRESAAHTASRRAAPPSPPPSPSGATT